MLDTVGTPTTPRATVEIESEDTCRVICIERQISGATHRRSSAPQEEPADATLVLDGLVDVVTQRQQDLGSLQPPRRRNP